MMTEDDRARGPGGPVGRRWFSEIPRQLGLGRLSPIGELGKILAPYQCKGLSLAGNVDARFEFPNDDDLSTFLWERSSKLEEMAGRKRSSRLEERQKGLRVRDIKREDLANKPEEN
ncbi:hypothetical protein F2Q69_00031296 [Brassica cretica]|uniref:Uncharacterized protein n=1 Tax=Brassica cretica TaxID=69181 RepID=A0A8S9RYL3_BRACR|nr:hypothetical protein F2Q69_00031296 [Brassica cretica]